jgi:hypothetical protein
MKFHKSAASGQKNGQSDQQRNFVVRFRNRLLLGFAFGNIAGKM